MKESIVKILRMLLLLSLALTACAIPTSTVVATPGETGTPPTSTPTPAPYWDLLPLTSEPEGGWKTYRSDEQSFTFQYPAVYDESECGEIWTKEMDTEEAAYAVIGMPGTIQVHIFESWTDDVAGRAFAIAAGPDLQTITQTLAPVEQFSIDGEPAYRLIYFVPAQADIDYTKVALVAFAVRLYQFSYHRMTYHEACDAPPLSEEAVYDYLLSTVEFIR
jgi:hypothetical protein